MDKDKRLWKLPNGRDREKLNLVLMCRAMVSKSLIQFSVDGQGSVPSLLFVLRPNYCGGNEDNGDLFHKEISMHCQPQCLQSTPPWETPEYSWASLGQSLVGLLLLSPGSWCTQGFVSLEDIWSISGGYGL